MRKSPRGVARVCRHEESSGYSLSFRVRVGGASCWWGEKDAAAWREALPVTGCLRVLDWKLPGGGGPHGPARRGHQSTQLLGTITPNSASWSTPGAPGAADRAARPAAREPRATRTMAS